MGDEKALEFVQVIFSEENRRELRELLKNKNISKEAYPVFFDIGAAKNNTELTAELQEYRNSL